MISQIYVVNNIYFFIDQGHNNRDPDTPSLEHPTSFEEVAPQNFKIQNSLNSWEWWALRVLSGEVPPSNCLPTCHDISLLINSMHELCSSGNSKKVPIKKRLRLKV